MRGVGGICGCLYPGEGVGVLNMSIPQHRFTKTWQCRLHRDPENPCTRVADRWRTVGTLRASRPGEASSPRMATIGEQAGCALASLSDQLVSLEEEDGGMVRPRAWAVLSRVEDWRKAP